MPREAHKVDFDVHSFAGSSAVPAEDTPVSAGSHALVHSEVWCNVDYDSRACVYP